MIVMKFDFDKNLLTELYGKTLSSAKFHITFMI